MFPFLSQKTATTAVLPASSLVTRRLRLAACLSELDCEADISAQLSRYFPGIAAPLWFDFVILPTADPAFLDLWVVAARVDEVKEAAALTATRVIPASPAWWCDLPVDFSATEAALLWCVEWAVLSEMNLLPWRQMQRARRRRWQQGLGLLGVTLVLLGVVASRYITLPLSTPPASDAALQRTALLGTWHRIRFVGYVQAGTDIWGIIVLPDGQTVDVRAGDTVLGTARVQQVSATQLVLQLPEHTQYVFSLVD